MAESRGIGNVLRHEYTRVAADALWRLVRDDLAVLDQAAAQNWRPCRPIRNWHTCWDWFLPVSTLHPCADPRTIAADPSTREKIRTATSPTFSPGQAGEKVASQL